SAMEASSSHLETLPEELLFEVIDYVPESIPAIREVSKTLNASVDAYASNSRSINMVERLDVDQGVDNEENPAAVWIKVKIAKKWSPLFERRLILCGLGYPIVTRESMNRYKLKFKPSDDPELFAKMNVCMGGRPSTAERRLTIPTVSPSDYNDYRIGYLRKLVDGFNIGSFIVEYLQILTNYDVDVIRTIIDDCNVGTLFLKFHTNETSDPTRVLLDLASRVHSMRITQERIPGKRGDDWPKHMFGVRNLDWASIIPRMFAEERRLEKLEFASHYAAEFLSEEAQAALRASLPQLDKKLWFVSSRLPQGEASKYVENGFTVETTTGAFSRLVVRHSYWDRDE
ncbi:hypothetical protein PRIPAC_79729, partial [Pristionchus pacificus]